MPKPSSVEKKPRADALRNRELLVATAKKIFAQKGPAATLDEIAKAADVGIGTLYRHFPTRDDLVDAVYQAESEHIFKAAHELSAKLPPVEAFRQWLLLFVDYMEMKNGMGEILNATAGNARKLKAAGPYNLYDAIDLLTKNATASGQIKFVGDPMNVLRAIAGVLNMNSSPDRTAAAKHMVDVMLAGLRAAR